MGQGGIISQHLSNRLSGAVMMYDNVRTGIQRSPVFVPTLSEPMASTASCSRGLRE